METYWVNKAACDDAERAYYEKLSGVKESENVENSDPPNPAPPAPTSSQKIPENTQRKKKADDKVVTESDFNDRLVKNPGAFRSVANGERTFIMLKPDAVQRGLVGEIIERFENRGFKLLAMKYMVASKDLLSNHYSDLSKKG